MRALPYRQLRNEINGDSVNVSSALPYRQLRNVTYGIEGRRSLVCDYISGSKSSYHYMPAIL